MVVAVRAWSKFIFGKLVVHYLDNDAARSAFIRANASASLGTALVAEYIKFEYRCRFSPCFARVASHSNPSDQPSRLDFTPTWLRDAERFELVLPVHLSQWGISGCTDTCKSWIAVSILKNWLGSMCPLCTFQLKLESWPASRNFPRQCKLWKKKGTLWIVAAVAFVFIHVWFLSRKKSSHCSTRKVLFCACPNFSGSVLKKHSEREKRNHVSARIQYIEFMYIYIHTYT